MPNQEEWRDTPYEGYQVSSQGRVRGRRGTVLWIGAGRNGRPAVALQMVRKKVAVAHLVCEAWHGPRPQGMWCLHRDDDPLNNTPENLYWGTPAENYADAKRHGRQRAKPWLARAKLTEEQVAAIRRRHESGERQFRLAEEYGISRARMSEIVNRKGWINA